MKNHNCAFLIEVFDEKRSGNLCKRRVSLDIFSAEEWLEGYARQCGYAMKEDYKELNLTFKMYDAGEHILTAKITNILLV